MNKIEKTNKKATRKTYSKQAGITLIALVITIVVLLILAGVSISTIFNDNGIIKKAQEAQNKMEQAKENDLTAINELNNWLEENGGIKNTTGGGTPTPPTPPVEKPLITDSNLTSNDRTTSESTTVIAKDEKENQVVVPGGFKISADSGKTVQQGIVIEDKDGNQFVWVPVSNINADGSNKIIKDDGSKVEITLGRYTFATTSPGTPTIIQKGSEYAETTVAKATAGTLDTKYRAGDYHYELSDYRVSNEVSNEKPASTGTNTTAKNLRAFIEKTNTNKGFYIARYEASYGSGWNSSGKTSEEMFGNAKPLSKVSTGYVGGTMNYTTKTLWTSITQPEAAIISQNMYKNDNYVESDLVNSYAWDTAIVYIQKMGNTNYANANRNTTGNNSPKNTGSTGDQKCKIFDMAGNESEWTTEYSTYTLNGSIRHCTYRGGEYSFSTSCTSSRDSYIATGSTNGNSFRPILYVK